MYEDFAKSRAKRSLDEIGEDEQAPSKGKVNHIFQALQYLRKVCNHPALVLNCIHPEYEEITAGLKSTGRSLHDIEHSPKLVALKFVRSFIKKCFQLIRYMYI